jgi:hypothetical protein
MCGLSHTRCICAHIPPLMPPVTLCFLLLSPQHECHGRRLHLLRILRKCQPSIDRRLFCDVHFSFCSCALSQCPYIQAPPYLDHERSNLNSRGLLARLRQSCSAVQRVLQNGRVLAGNRSPVSATPTTSPSPFNPGKRLDSTLVPASSPLMMREV